MSLISLLELVREAYKGYTPDVVATLILSPFRSIERLLEKMNDGVPFDEVKDAGVWYDPVVYELHFDDTTVSASYQGKPNKEHFALRALFTQFDEPRIDYADIPEFDQDNKETEKRSYRDALNRFIKKHPRLAEIFAVQTDHLAIKQEYLEHPH